MSVEEAANGYKIVVVGSSGVGKSAMVQCLITGSFREEEQPTIGVEFKPYTIQVEDENVKLQIWDTAGQERFKSVSKAYFRNALGGILVFDITNRDSFDDLVGWLNDMRQLCAPNASIILIGNKVDLEDDRVVIESEASAYAERYNLSYMETSAKSGKNIQEAFIRLGTEIVHKVKSGEIVVPKPSDKTLLTESNIQTNNNKSCC
ncbi:Ras family protein [Histomonas meleagridis]|uniref:Ras family protein n=1 Tax=Histomonas meleagridis TaxID=135588 RepID=UPI003559B5BE|nr:Ras family protein [Histomonas meleagridis]KAH0796743.1 Ras family protein [Histomonas meleagridis]